jgi:hypothetical protein
VPVDRHDAPPADALDRRRLVGLFVVDGGAGPEGGEDGAEIPGLEQRPSGPFLGRARRGGIDGPDRVAELDDDRRGLVGRPGVACAHRIAFARPPALERRRARASGTSLVVGDTVRRRGAEGMARRGNVASPVGLGVVEDEDRSRSVRGTRPTPGAPCIAV